MAPKGPFYCNNNLCVCAADAWHKRLVRYYSYFGFERVRAVGDNGLRDLPDLLVWGGVGEQTFHTLVIDLATHFLNRFHYDYDLEQDMKALQKFGLSKEEGRPRLC